MGSHKLLSSSDFWEIIQQCFQVGNLCLTFDRFPLCVELFHFSFPKPFFIDFWMRFGQPWASKSKHSVRYSHQFWENRLFQKSTPKSFPKGTLLHPFGHPFRKKCDQKGGLKTNVIFWSILRPLLGATTPKTWTAGDRKAQCHEDWTAVCVFLLVSPVVSML